MHLHVDSKTMILYVHVIEMLLLHFKCRSVCHPIHYNTLVRSPIGVKLKAKYNIMPAVWHY